MNLSDAARPLASPPTTTADQISGVRCSPSRCVAANALHRLRGVLDVRVGARTMRLLRRSGWVRYDIEENSRMAIKAYDEAGETIPVGFVVRFVPPAKKLGARGNEAPGSNRRSQAQTSVATRRPSHRHIDVEPT